MLLILRMFDKRFSKCQVSSLGYTYKYLSYSVEYVVVQNT